MVAETRPPLPLGPAAVPPTRGVDRDDPVDGFTERRNGPLGAGQDQIAAPSRHQVQNALLTGLGQADVRPGSESEIASPPVHDDALRPGLGKVAAGGPPDEQRQPSGAAPVPVAAGSDDDGGKGCDAEIDMTFDVLFGSGTYGCETTRSVTLTCTWDAQGDVDDDDDTAAGTEISGTAGTNVTLDGTFASCKVE